MSHPVVPSGGLFGSVMGGITSILLLGIGLTETHPWTQDVALILSMAAAALSIFCSGVTIWKLFRR